MPTRSYRDIAAAAKTQWSPEVREFSTALGEQLEAEVTAQVQLGRELAALRKGAALSQTELAARASTDQAEISRIERGLGNPTRDTLVRVAAVVGARLSLVPGDARHHHA